MVKSEKYTPPDVWISTIKVKIIQLIDDKNTQGLRRKR
ncbi:hypothetical protein FM120_17815 [Sphingobacterium faecium PCAi_F2.5]|nr:hypothetical protein FM120_17815 [Sphingobacterium faecium PCAi_F2.5]